MAVKTVPAKSRITVRVDKDVYEAFERFMAESGMSKGSKQEAYRHVVRDWLGTHGYLKRPPARPAA